jgi:hypothetical protein
MGDTVAAFQPVPTSQVSQGETNALLEASAGLNGTVGSGFSAAVDTSLAVGGTSALQADLRAGLAAGPGNGVTVQSNAGLRSQTGPSVNGKVGLTVGGTQLGEGAVNFGSAAGGTGGQNPGGKPVSPGGEGTGNLGIIALLNPDPQVNAAVQVSGHLGGGDGDIIGEAVVTITGGIPVRDGNPGGAGTAVEGIAETEPADQFVFLQGNPPALQEVIPPPGVETAFLHLPPLEGTMGAGRQADDHLGAPYQDEGDEAHEVVGEAPLLGGADQGATTDEEPDLPDLQGAGLAAEFLPADLDALNASLQQFLDQLGTLRVRLARSPLAPWVVAVTAAVVAGEAARQRWRRSPRGLVLTGGGSAGWDWFLGLPESDSDPDGIGS